MLSADGDAFKGDGEALKMLRGVNWRWKSVKALKGNRGDKERRGGIKRRQ